MEARMAEPRSPWSRRRQRLIRDKDHLSIADQYKAAAISAHYIADMVEAGWNVIVTHGNGPQMGFILRRSGSSITKWSRRCRWTMPAPTCRARSAICSSRPSTTSSGGAGCTRQAVAVVTETLVDRNDPAFANPTKPIGSHMEEGAPRRLAAK